MPRFVKMPLLIVMSSTLATAAWSQYPTSYFLIDKQGQALLALQELGYVSYGKATAYSMGFYEGLAVVQRGGSTQRYFGFIDKEGQWVVQPLFETPPRHFSDGLAAVPRDFKRTSWGYIGRDGQWAFRSTFLDARNFSDGLAAVCTGGGPDNIWRFRYAFIDKSGQIAIEPDFAWVTDFSEGVAGAAVPFNGYYKWGIIDKEGNWVMSPDQSEISGMGTPEIGDTCDSDYDPERYRPIGFSEGVAAAASSGGWGYVDKEGQWVIRPMFASVGTFSEGLAAAAVRARRDGTTAEADVWGFIDRTGNWVIPPRFTHVRSFSGGVAAVELELKRGRGEDPQTKPTWAFIDKTGNWAVERLYYEAWNLLEDVAFVSTRSGR